jgi:hypothetical protein
MKKNKKHYNFTEKQKRRDTYSKNWRSGSAPKWCRKMLNKAKKNKDKKALEAITTGYNTDAVFTWYRKDALWIWW